MYTEFGSLIIRTYVADEAVPVSDVDIIVKGADADNAEVIYIVSTDYDGISPTLKLPAPEAELSRSPGADLSTYARYDVEIKKDGYYTKIVSGIAVFAGVEAVLPVNMIPYAENGDYPRGNINTAISDSYGL